MPNDRTSHAELPASAEPRSGTSEHHRIPVLEVLSAIEAAGCNPSRVGIAEHLRTTPKWLS